MRKIALILFLFTFAFSACENDDICDPVTPTTPRLVISFFDASNPALKKNITNLKVVGQGMEDGVIFSPTANGDNKYLANGVNTISIPLKTFEDSTTFLFTLNFGNPNSLLTNTDILQFNYSRNDIYVSRACGYKTLFTFNDIAPVVQTDKNPSDGNWMKFVILERKKIENETETHLNIYF